MTTITTPTPVPTDDELAYLGYQLTLETEFRERADDLYKRYRMATDTHRWIGSRFEALECWADLSDLILPEEVQKVLNN